jgi:MFS superfamily sulfate permease-like transporter
MEISSPSAWEANWAWGVPLIVLTSVVHVLGLGLINERVVHALSGRMDRRHSMFLFAAAMSVAILLATILHAFEAAVWAAAYLLLHALPDMKTAMLYSVSAMTTYGHASALLADRWKMLGALEALNGMLLFGLTTAFLFAMIQEIWSPRAGTARRSRSARSLERPED